MIPRPDLLSDDSVEGIEVVQITNEDVPSGHVYMEAQIFTPDSKRFVLHRSSTAHGSDKDDPEHRYLLCDIEYGCLMSPLTDELGVTGPVLSPDGEWFYYFVNRTEIGGGSLTLKRVRVDGTERETIMVIDERLPGTSYWVYRVYPLSTISSDGKKIAISSYMDAGKGLNNPGGLMVFDIEKASVELILDGDDWINIHPQYCRATDDEAKRDIMVQQNHGYRRVESGGDMKIEGDTLGADIHLIRDDGMRFRNLPAGRDGNERCHGHQCWRGRSEYAIVGTGTKEPDARGLIETKGVEDEGHIGLKVEGGKRNDLARLCAGQWFAHFGTDIAGRRLITDSSSARPGVHLFVGELGRAGVDAMSSVKYLLTTGANWGNNDTHAHPFLSPDGSMGFYNSDESGVLQAYMIRGLDRI